MWISTLDCIGDTELEYDVPPGAVAMMLVQLSDADSVYCYLRIIEHFPAGAPTGRGGSGPVGQIWFKGEIIPLWGRLSGQSFDDARIKRFGIHHRGGGQLADADGGYRKQVQVCWLERKDLLDRFEHTPAERFQTWQPQQIELPDNRIQGGGVDWVEKNWIRVPSRGMRYGVLVIESEVGTDVPFYLSIANGYESVPGFVGNYRRRAALVPLFLAPCWAASDEPQFRTVIPFHCDPNAHEVLVRAWKVSPAGSTPARSHLMLSSAKISHAMEARTGAARAVCAAGNVGTALQNAICCARNPVDGGQRLSAAGVVRNWHAANAANYYLIYAVNLGLEMGQDHAEAWAASGAAIAANTTAQVVMPSNPWHCAVGLYYGGAGVALDGAITIKAHQ